MRIFGLMMVRNEEEILEVCLRHHLAQGIERFLVVDNGSSDGTGAILRAMHGEGHLDWTRDEGPYHQGEITTRLAHEAYLQGADWVVPIDADELWCGEGARLAEVLARAPATAGALEVEVVNFIQRRDQQHSTLEGLATMTRRCPAPVGPVDRIFDLVDRRQIAYVEAVYPTKWICRASLLLRIGMGNHRVRGVVDERETTEQIVCLHAPLRSRSVLEAKAADHGPRATDLGIARDIWWQVRRWHRVREQGELEAEWRANSFDPADDEGGLDVFGERHATVLDTRWRDSVLPWLDQARARSEAAAVSDESRAVKTTQPDEGDEPAALRLRVGRQQEGIDALQRELERRDRLSADRLGEKQQAIDWLREQLDGKQQAVDALRERLDEGQRGLDDKQQALDDRQQALDDKQRALDDKQQALDWLNDQLLQRDAQILERDAQILERDRALDERQRAIDWLRERIRALERPLLERGQSALREGAAALARRLRDR